MKQLVTIYNNHTLITDSIIVAEVFGKEHKHVMRDIKEMECSESFRRSNFGPSSYFSVQNKELPKYLITQDGFTLLVMGYTGSEAMKFKEMYIAEFNRMKNELNGVKVINTPKSFAEALRLAADLQEQKERLEIENTEKQLKLIQQEPMVYSFKKWLDADGCMNIGTFAKMIGIGRNNLFKILKSDELKILMNNNQPYQRYMQYFKIVDRVKVTEKRTRSFPTTLLNHNGCEFIKRKLQEVGAL